MLEKKVENGYQRIGISETHNFKNEKVILTFDGIFRRKVKREKF